MIVELASTTESFQGQAVSDKVPTRSFGPDSILRCLNDFFHVPELVMLLILALETTRGRSIYRDMTDCNRSSPLCRAVACCAILGHRSDM
jgi:hypothetical protein